MKLFSDLGRVLWVGGALMLVNCGAGPLSEGAVTSVPDAASPADAGSHSLPDPASITGLHFTTTSTFPDNPRPIDVDVVLTDQVPTRAIYVATLALPEFPPGIHRCPADLGYGHGIAFTGARGVLVMATLNAGGCRDATISDAPPTRQTNGAYWQLLAANLGVEESTLFSFPAP